MRFGVKNGTNCFTSTIRGLYSIHFFLVLFDHLLKPFGILLIEPFDVLAHLLKPFGILLLLFDDPFGILLLLFDDQLIEPIDVLFP